MVTNNTIVFIFMGMLANSVWSAALLDNGDGTVSDFDTGLEWQQLGDNTQRNYANALSYCTGLVLADMQDWRLPNIKELKSIIDYDVASPSINHSVFSTTNPQDYWTATLWAVDNNSAWYVDFSDGLVSAIGKTSSYHVRCVR